jgi:putative membrane protein
MFRWTSGNTAARRRQAEFHQALTECTEAVQPGTRVSVAVVIRHSSGSYLDVAFLVGFAVSWCGLLLILFVPHEVHPFLVPVDVLLLFVIGSWLGGRTPLGVWLTPRRRRRRQVKTASHAAFVEEGVYHAQEDMGLLIYWSRLEKRVEVVAGIGVQNAVPMHDFHTAVHALRRAVHMPETRTAFLGALRQLGQLLARHLPTDANHSAQPLAGGRAR